MKKRLYITLAVLSLMLAGCSNWLEIESTNEQSTDDYWQAKEDVEAVVAAGYYYMSGSTTSSLIDWGELRGGSIYYSIIEARYMLASFQMVASASLCKWESFYNVINMANSVLQYAPGIQTTDMTYTEEALNAHLAEAYFMRAWAYFVLVRNFKEVPLVTDAYVDDSHSFDLAKSTEEEIIAQIKQDIVTALPGARTRYDGAAWQNKGRATKWALYALMADVCLWNEEYDEAVAYCDSLLNASASGAELYPVFMSIPSQWITIFSEGNTNESIFEFNYDYTLTGSSGGSPSRYFKVDATAGNYLYAPAMLERLRSETQQVKGGTEMAVRSWFGAFVGDVDVLEDITEGYVWKYQTNGYANKENTRTNSDANWIVYRMAEIKLIKAQALIMQGAGKWEEAVKLMNDVRRRANLPELEVTIADMDEESMLLLVLNEKDMELAGEGKRWYDLLWFGKCANYKYKDSFIELMVENNDMASDTWLRSVLKNPDAWYLPIYAKELETNKLLEQNPYYNATN